MGDATAVPGVPRPGAQEQCTLGIAAYWLEMFFIAPELNVHSVG